MLYNISGACMALLSLHMGCVHIHCNRTLWCKLVYTLQKEVIIAYFSLFDHSLTSEWAAIALKICAMITYSIDCIDNDHFLLQTMVSWKWIIMQLSVVSPSMRRLQLNSFKGSYNLIMLSFNFNISFIIRKHVVYSIGPGVHVHCTYYIQTRTGNVQTETLI